MCLTIPGKVVRVTTTDPSAPTADVDFEGVRRTASLLFLPDVRVGEFVLVQAGIAIARVPPDEAERALALARQPLEPAPSPVPSIPEALPSGGPP